MKSILYQSLLCAALLFACAEKEEPAATVMPESVPTDVAPEIITTPYPGAYTGILPCADCEGIKIQLVLNDDGTYLQEIQYLGKEAEPHVYTGTFSWSEMGNIAKLESAAGGIEGSFLMGEKTLTLLDANGAKIEGALAERYILRKAD